MSLIRMIRQGRARLRRVKSRGHNIRTSLFVLTILTMSSGAFAGDLDKVALFNIQAQPLGSALLQFGAQAHVQISFASDSFKAGLRTHRIQGTYTGRQVLVELLKGTHLRYVTHKQT